MLAFAGLISVFTENLAHIGELQRTEQRLEMDSERQLLYDSAPQYPPLVSAQSINAAETLYPGDPVDSLSHRSWIWPLFIPRYLVKPICTFANPQVPTILTQIHPADTNCAKRYSAGARQHSRAAHSQGPRRNALPPRFPRPPAPPRALLCASPSVTPWRAAVTAANAGRWLFTRRFPSGSAWAGASCRASASRCSRPPRRPWPEISGTHSLLRPQTAYFITPLPLIHPRPLPSRPALLTAARRAASAPQLHAHGRRRHRGLPLRPGTHITRTRSGRGRAARITRPADGPAGAAAARADWNSARERVCGRTGAAPSPVNLGRVLARPAPAPARDGGDVERQGGIETDGD
jgi:hypothetical protein